MINTFAENNRLKVEKDDCGDAIIPGKYGHIYEYGSGKLGVCIMSNSGNGLSVEQGARGVHSLRH